MRADDLVLTGIGLALYLALIALVGVTRALLFLVVWIPFCALWRRHREPR